jgi:hypothetical protein
MHNLKRFSCFRYPFRGIGCFFHFLLSHKPENLRNRISKNRNRISKRGKQKDAISGVILNVVFSNFKRCSTAFDVIAF